MRILIFLTILFLALENFNFSQTKNYVSYRDFSIKDTRYLSIIHFEDSLMHEKSYNESTKRSSQINRNNYIENSQTFLNENIKIHSSNLSHNDTLGYLKISRTDGKNNKERIILENKKILIITTDSVKVKGKLKFINKDSIQIKSNTIAINNIVIIKKPINAARITGNIFGGLFSYIGVASSIDQYEPIYFLIGSAISMPFYAMNYVRRKYVLNSKWKAEIVSNKNYKKP
ncbi:MAG: hypothetical protein K9I37_08700 [Crocinitomicaceae bacterium]|nr:hypothetical protein [Crocinitomicaceae bacterium]